MDTTHPQYQDQLRAIGQQVHALQRGRHTGPALAVVSLMLDNVRTLKAWTDPEYAAAREAAGDPLPTVASPTDVVLPPVGDELETWTAVGHWENDRIVVEYAVRGEVEDPREDVGYWPEGLWADSGSGVDRDAAVAAAVREAEVEHLGLETRVYTVELTCDSQGHDGVDAAMVWLAENTEGDVVLEMRRDDGVPVYATDSLASDAAADRAPAR